MFLHPKSYKEQEMRKQTFKYGCLHLEIWRAVTTKKQRLALQLQNVPYGCTHMLRKYNKMLYLENIYKPIFGNMGDWDCQKSRFLFKKYKSD